MPQPHDVVVPFSIDVETYNRTFPHLRREASPNSVSLSAVVMEFLYGRPLDELTQEERAPYEPAIVDLARAMDENGLLDRDTREQEVICLEGSSNVALTDAELIEIFESGRPDVAGGWTNFYLKEMGMEPI